MRAPRLALSLLLPAALALAGCASRTERVEAALVKAGVPHRLAACLAPRLTSRLSDDQLRALARAPEGDGEGGRGIAGIVARVAGTGDPAIVDAVSAAALHCAIP